MCGARKGRERDRDSRRLASWPEHGDPKCAWHWVSLMVTSPLTFWSEMKRAKFDEYGELDRLI